MKKYILILFIVAVFSPIKAFANNLLINPNFENGVNDWTVGGPNWQAQSSVVEEGTISAQNTITTIGTPPNNIDYFSSLSQTFATSAGQTVYATLKTKTNINPKAFAVAGVLVEFLNSSDVVLKSAQDQVGGLTDWRFLYASATAPTGTMKVRFSTFVYAAKNETGTGGIALSGNAYFDEAVLSTQFISPPPTATALINAGFENGLHDWKYIYQPGLSADDITVHQGVYSTKNTIGAIAGQDFFSSAYQDLAYASPGHLWASAWVKTNISALSSTGIAGLKLEFYNQLNPPAGTAPLGSAELTLRGVNNWTRVLIQNVTPPAGTIMVRVLTFTYALQTDSAAIGGIGNFDDVIFSYSALPANDLNTGLLNPNFENGLNFWSDLYGFPATTSSTAHGGTLATKKTIGVISGQDYYSQLYEDVYFNTSGGTYPTNTLVYATVYLKTNMNPITKSNAGLQFEFINSSGQVIKDVNNKPIIVVDEVGGQTDWKYLYVAGQTPAGTVRVRVSGTEFARKQDSSLNGDAYYDDFIFSVIPLTPPPAQTSLINSGFENGLNDWKENNKPGGVTTSTIFNGNYASSFAIDNDVLVAINYYGTASQDVQTGPATFVTAKVWAKSAINPITTPVGGLSIQFLDANNQPLGAEVKQEIGGMRDWTQLSVAATAPFGVSKVRYTMYMFGDAASALPGDKVFFDDASLTFSSDGPGPRQCSPGVLNPPKKFVAGYLQQSQCR